MFGFAKARVRERRLRFLGLLVLLCAACDYDRGSIPTHSSPTEPSQSEPDAAFVDSGTCEEAGPCDAALQTPPRAGNAAPKAGSDATSNAASDAMPEAGIDLAADAGSDAAPERCAAGFEEDADGGCDDFDECTTELRPCDPLRACLNTEGAFDCGPCPSGYDEIGTRCADIDECSWTPNPCPGNARCVNMTGSYRCECETGYARTLHGLCVDIDECATVSPPCDEVASCTNSPGSFTCTCPAYYDDEEAGSFCRDTRYRWDATLVGVNGAQVAPDHDGNLFVVAAFSGLTHFGGQNLMSAGSLDLIVAKLDSAREVAWVRQFGGAGTDATEWVAVDAAGDFIFAGQTAGGFDMGCGPLNTRAPGTRYVAKLRSADGACVWSALMPHAGTAGEDDPWLTVAVDPANNVLISGHFFSTLDVGATHLTSAGSSDIYIAKFSPTGDVLWARSWGSAADASSHGIAAYADGSIALFGSFTGSLSLGGEEFTSRGGRDLVLARLTPDGDHIWSRQDGGGEWDWGGTLALDSAGNAFVVGYFYGFTTLGDEQFTSAGAWDLFATKVDPVGEITWTRHFGGSGDDAAWAVATDDRGNMFATGPFNGSIDFGEGDRTAMDSWDAFIVKLDPEGQHVWSQRFGGTGWDKTGYLVAGDSGDLYVTGYFGPPVDFGGGQRTTGSMFVLELRP